jgi:hypothetical protein
LVKGRGNRFEEVDTPSSFPGKGGNKKERG